MTHCISPFVFQRRKRIKGKHVPGRLRTGAQPNGYTTCRLFGVGSGSQRPLDPGKRYSLHIDNAQIPPQGSPVVPALLPMTVSIRHQYNVSCTNRSQCAGHPPFADRQNHAPQSRQVCKPEEHPPPKWEKFKRVGIIEEPLIFRIIQFNHTRSPRWLLLQSSHRLFSYCFTCRLLATKVVMSSKWKGWSGSNATGLCRNDGSRPVKGLFRMILSQKIIQRAVIP